MTSSQINDECTWFIVTKNGEYLVAAPYADTLMVRWSNSKYDGYRMKRYRLAKMVATRVGGRVVEFNTITGAVVN